MLLLIGCTSDTDESDLGVTDETGGDVFSDTGGGGTGDPGNGGDPLPAGVITAGEWNDLANWPFWTTLLNNKEYSEMPEYWSFNTLERIAVVVNNNGIPAANISVKLFEDDTLLWEAITDNKGDAALWPNVFDEHSLQSLRLEINNGEVVLDDVKLFIEGVNEVNISGAIIPENSIEISFVVDATGSMGDELEFLKVELEDVLGRVKNDNGNTTVATSSVFYRDIGDEYVTKVANFSTNVANTINFIREQKADGGGDYPEAVHTALNKSINELQWSSNVKSRLLFLLLDAPPHYETQIVDEIQSLIQTAAKKGIKVIPVTASGIDKETEFLMRFMSITSNGTYVFITNDSGVGNDHLEASVGEYEVEFLNDLIVRLINESLE